MMESEGGEGCVSPVGDGVVVFVDEIGAQRHGQRADGHDLGAWGGRGRGWGEGGE